MLFDSVRGCAVLILLLACTQAAGQQVGEHVSISGDVDDDLYLAGGQVDLYATVAGDVVAAGGRLNLEGDVNQDVIAAGGSIELRGDVGDDARLAGGDVRVLGVIGDDLLAAGGRLQVGPLAEIGGGAWVSGGDLRIEGRIAKQLHASGGRVVISGSVGGDAEIRAEHLEIGESAVISGRLHYHGPNPAMIAQGARIEGDVTYTPVEIPLAPLVAGLLVFSFVYVLSLIATAVVLYLVFPGFAGRCSETIRGQPWSSIGLGAAVFAGGPLVIVILLSTGIGVWLALLLLAAYLALLLAGYLAGAYFLADTALRRLDRQRAGKKARSLSLALAVLLLAVINLIPLLGGLVSWLVLLAGMGAIERQVAKLYAA